MPKVTKDEWTVGLSVDVPDNHGGSLEPVTTRELADKACVALGWVCVGGQDESEGIWLCRLPLTDVKLAFERDGGLYKNTEEFVGELDTGGVEEFSTEEEEVP